MADPWNELLAIRNQLSDALRLFPDVLKKVYRPPIIDPSGGSFNGEDAIIPGFKSFETSVEKEIDSLDKVLNERPLTSTHVSSNAPYFLSAWKEIHAATSVVSVAQAFAIQDPSVLKKLQDDVTKKGHKAQQTTLQVKVDVIADEGASWIRVNTIKNSRLQAEFSEIDAYSDSEDESGEEGDKADGNTSAGPSWQNNSVLRMGAALLVAAKANPIPGTNRTPKVYLRLTRLEPNEREPRISQTIQELEKMGIEVWLGERPDEAIPVPAPSITLDPIPSADINFDLSILVAIVSDITHAPLAATPEESLARYKPLVRKWKGKALKEKPADAPIRGFAAHCRALGVQAEQERICGLFDDLRNRLHAQNYETSRFYASAEARDRLKGILAKIGGEGERRRAEMLFSSDPNAERDFWQGSRFSTEEGYHLKGLIPIRVNEESEADVGPAASTPFFSHLASTCEALLREFELEGVTADSKGEHVPIRATSQSRSPALTPHTVRSLLQGARRGMTTVTANKASVRAILREMKRTSPAEGLEKRVESLHLGLAPDTSAAPVAALWVVEPRSLAENMRADVIGDSGAAPLGMHHPVDIPEV